MTDEYILKDKVLNLIEHNDRVCHYADERYENVVYATARTICRVVADIPASDVQPVDRWISVEDRLPATRKTVLIYDEYEGVSAGYYDSDYAKFRSIEDVYRSCNVTHWQPIPEPPKEGEQND